MDLQLIILAQQYGTCKARNGRAGECINAGTCASNGGTSDPANLCPGDKSIQCCTYGTCRNRQGIAGICQPVSTCSGISDPVNLCPGGNNIQCCTSGDGSGGLSSFNRIMNIVLPPLNGIAPHITSHYGQRGGEFHGGTDFNYNVPGQYGINIQHPNVYSPVDGVVTFVGGDYGTVKIGTSTGYSHEILHLHTAKVQVNNNVRSGQLIGTMGGKGPNGFTQYAQHVHYQIKDRSGQTRNPENYL
ncbi:unnamed protein product [Rotaria magnacalcarata]|uniref:M23ase beta-sheet core domain-containing protein n=2 Tax=Rotaria magnacalcarata TaxID=392030 RepID=A0A816UVM5_9BILA|nr:unnamed protein product [Rotaria magnacalcarata]